MFVNAHFSQDAAHYNDVSDLKAFVSMRDQQ